MQQIPQIMAVAALAVTAQHAVSDSTTLDEVIVIGQRLATIPSVATTTTKSSLALIDTPATVTVIDRELIDAQLAVTLQDVLRNASGVNQAGTITASATSSSPAACR